MGILVFIDAAAYFANTVLSAVLAALCIFLAQKHKASQPFYFLLIGFYICVFLCNAFIILTWLVIDYPYIISPADLSWMGAIVFLITADMGMMDAWTAEQKQAAHKIKLPALAAPAICTVFNIVFITIYPEITANYILYYIPTAILSYYALMLFLAGSVDGVQSNLRSYHGATLIWIAFQLLHDLFSTLGWDYGFAVPGTVFVWLIVFSTAGIYIAVRKGADA